MTVTVKISIQYRCAYDYVECDPRLPRESSKNNYTRNYHEFVTAIQTVDSAGNIDGFAKSKTDKIICKGRVKDQVLQLMEADSANPFKDAVFESSYENPQMKDKRSSVTLTANSFEEAYEKFSVIRKNFISWANQKFKEYGVCLVDKAEIIAEKLCVAGMAPVVEPLSAAAAPKISIFNTVEASKPMKAAVSGIQDADSKHAPTYKSGSS